MRGQHAVEVVKLERRLELIETDRALGKAEIGRQAGRIADLEALSQNRAEEIELQRSEISALSVEARELRVQLGAQEIALLDLTHQRDIAIQEFSRARARIMEMETAIDQNRAVIATLETRMAGLGVEHSDLRRSSTSAAAAAEAERKRLSASLAEMSERVARLADELAAARRRATALQAEHEVQLLETLQLQERVDSLEARLAGSELAREEATLEITRQFARISERDAALKRAEAEVAELTRQIEAAKAREASLATLAQSSATSNAASEGALNAERHARSELQREVEHLRARLAEANAAAQTVAKGDQALRQSIARLGREIARAHDNAESESLHDAQIVNFARRDPAATFGLVADPTAAAGVRDGQPAASGG